MIRRAAAVVVALTLFPALLHAQDTVFTVTAASAEVHAGASTINPVIGHVARGTVLPVLRNLGSWVRVPWPDAKDGVGYVHVSMGRLVAAADAPRPVTTTPAVTRTAASEPIAPRRSTAMPPARGRTLTPASHIVGLGALVSPTSSFGGTARVWHNDRLGIQFALTRDAMTSEVAAGRMTSTAFEPGVVYALFDRVGDYVWFRPYVGSVVSFRRERLSAVDPGAVASESNHDAGFRVFAGSELTFASVPRFGLSADVGYRRFSTPFPGFEPKAMSASIAGHWYIK